tara:strand:- start:769 stop:1017 length:249 start_codon:yes stop_codon:yes gene_type:complete
LEYSAFSIYGGEREIRTLERDKPLHAFQACAFSHSASSPNFVTAIKLRYGKKKASLVQGYFRLILKKQVKCCLFTHKHKEMA